MKRKIKNLSEKGKIALAAKLAAPVLHRLPSNIAFQSKDDLFVREFNRVAKEAHDTAVEKGFWARERNDGEALCLIHSEISEALEALRNGNPEDDKLPGYSGATVELADAIIRIMDFAQGRGWKVAEVIAEKMKYNRLRPPKHGKAF